MCSNGSRDVVAGLRACARFACAMCEAFAVALHAYDVVGRTRRFVRHVVAAEAVDANQRFDRARFVDCVRKFVGCGELNHCRVLLCFLLRLSDE